MNICLNMTLIATTIFLCGCQTGSEARTDKELRTVSEKFSNMLNDGKLPGLAAKVEGGHFSVARVDNRVRNQDWFSAFKAGVSGCKDAYWVSMEINNRNLLYLYCLDLGSPNLIGSFENQKGNWVPIK